MAKSAVERKRLSREKLKQDEEKWKEHLEKERNRDKMRRENKKQQLGRNKQKLKLKRLHDRERQKKCRLNKQLLATERPESPSSPSTSSPLGSYRSTQSLGKAVSRCRKSLPKSPNKKTAVIKKLVMEVLPDVGKTILKEKKSGNNKISQEVKDKVLNFYCRDDISYQAPGKRDFKSIKNKESGKRERIQKRHMCMTIGEAYELFKNENNVKLGNSTSIKKSKFYDLRPEFVIPIKETPRNVCICKYHANFDFLIQAVRSLVPEFPGTCKNLISKLCCNTEDEKCMTGFCLECQTDIETLLNDEVVDFDSILTWKQWNEIEGFPKVVEVDGSLLDAINEIKSQLAYIKIHCFVKNAQSKYFEEKKENLEENECVLQVDFAENYEALYQDEISSAHWNHLQATVFTSYTWLKGAKRPMAIISDELSHDKTAVWVFMKAILTKLKNEFPQLEKVFVFSDGCAAQFKNRYTLQNLCFMNKDFRFTGEWNFFATSHGKGAVDSIGGTIKRKALMQVKARKVIINSALDFYNCVSQQESDILTLYVPAEEIATHKLMLEKRWEVSYPIPMLQSKHHFQVENHNHLLVARTVKSTQESIKVCDEPMPPIQNLTTGNTEKDFVIEDISLHDFVQVALRVENQRRNKAQSTKRIVYYAEVIGVNIERHEVLLKYMHRSGSFWIWPEEEKSDISTEHISVILKKVSPPIPVNNKGQFQFQ